MSWISMQNLCAAMSMTCPNTWKVSLILCYTSYGTIGWLPDLDPWAQVIAHFLKKGGYFYMADFHPIVWMLDEEMEFIKYAYHNDGVIETDNTGTYADRDAAIRL